jgi:GTP-binding protein
LFALGFGAPLFLSAEHNLGIAPLCDLFQLDLAAASHFSSSSDPIRLAIIGRPNVGKSTLINAILGEQRLITGTTAGLTRDAIPIPWHYKEQAFALIDTAGQRRQARITGSLERLAVAKTRSVAATADIMGLVLDITVPIEKQDLTLGRRAIDNGIPLVIILNKCDKTANPQKVCRVAQESVAQGLSQEKGIPVIAVSAQNGTNLKQIFSWSLKLHRRARTTLGTAALNRWLQAAIQRYPPPTHKGKMVHLKYITQIGRDPLSFLIFGARTEMISHAYKRYLLKGLVEKFCLEGVPIKIILRQTENPYGTAANKSIRSL